MPRGVKEWSPDPIRDMVEALEDHTVDSEKFVWDRQAREMAEHQMIGAANPILDGAFWSTHITDDPAPMLEAVKRGFDLAAAEPEWFGGPMCPGMHVTTATDYWRIGRSSKRYAFLKTLAGEAKEALRRIILADLAQKRGSGYITESEYENAVSHVEDLWIKHGNWRALFTVINQPYNVDVPRIARDAGLAVPAEPVEVPVLFVGRYLSFSEPDALKDAYRLAEAVFPDRDVGQKEICLALRRHGWDGVFTTSGFSTEPQLIIMNAAKVLRFGDWSRDPGAWPPFGGKLGSVPPALSGAREEGGTWIPGARFEASVAEDGRTASILDRQHGTRLGPVDAAGMRAMRSVVDAAARAMDGQGPRHSEAGRFVSDVGQNLSRANVMDLEAAGPKSAFTMLSREGLDELRELVYTLLELLEAA